MIMITITISFRRQSWQFKKIFPIATRPSAKGLTQCGGNSDRWHHFITGYSVKKCLLEGPLRVPWKLRVHDECFRLLPPLFPCFHVSSTLRSHSIADFQRTRKCPFSCPKKIVASVWDWLSGSACATVEILRVGDSAPSQTYYGAYLAIVAPALLRSGERRCINLTFIPAATKFTRLVQTSYCTYGSTANFVISLNSESIATIADAEELCEWVPNIWLDSWDIK